MYRLLRVNLTPPREQQLNLADSQSASPDFKVMGSRLQAQRGRSLVKRLLLIVLLLDRAASEGFLAGQAPLLFLPEASWKSSAQVKD